MSGLIPVRRGSNTPYSGGVSRYYVSASDSTAIFIGDPVVMDNTNAETPGKYPTVKRATLAANNQTIGPMIAVQPVTDETKNTAPTFLTYRPASVAAYVLVADDPDQEFIVAEDADTTPIAATALGNLGILITGTGSTIYGTSGLTLDSSGFAAGVATGQYLLLGLVDRADLTLVTTSGATGNYFRVKINEAMHGLATPPTAV